MPVRSDLLENLEFEAVLNEINSSTSAKCLSTAPPVQPRGGQLFVYDLGPDEKLWERKRRKFR